MKIYTGFEIEVETSGFRSDDCRHYALANKKILDLASKTKHITSTDLQNIACYHTSRTDFRSTDWRLESDGSLINGAEFISPPEPMETSIKKLFDFFDCIDNSRCTTSKRCGLHVNMSANNKTLDGVDIATFITLINQRLLFKFWGHRMKNHQYVQSMQNILKLRQHDMLSVYSLQNNINTKIEDISNIVVQDRYSFVNKRTINGKKYIEIRIIGGNDYHKKKEEIKQTIEHFAKILEQAKTPQPLHKKTCKKITSYINRIDYSDNKNIFMPHAHISFLLSHKEFANKIEQLKNIHKCSAKDFLEKIEKEGYISPITTHSMARKVICFNGHDDVRKYFNKCIDYMFGNVAIYNSKKRNDYINYINYHYIKFIYNNFSKKQCSRCLTDMRLKICYGLYLPNNEPKRNILWMIKVMRIMSIHHRKQFVNKLPIQLIDYILSKKVPGLITLAKTRKKDLKNQEIKLVGLWEVCHVLK